ncbi:Swi3-domain-containing protein [Suillus paluster]|uniref:Swi3-domain-containing protein n=1 Tax=Suillus paluster TaxID=48578 RepID=UPI001B87911D|nr:Swi3-domain-containing protein [Suillus paluster]KAG1756716.1 Swi3-domain-containing protein [Suillus paluster]
MSLDDIWDAPIVPTCAVTLHSDTTSPQKRPRETLFLSDSDDEDEQPAPKRPTSSAPRPDVDALFADIDKDESEEEDGLRYKPLAPALDLEALRKQAAAKHALTPHQILPSSSPPRDVGPNEDDEEGKDNKGKGKEGKKERKKVTILDEESLVGAAGFPQLITNIKDFRVKGKGHEHSDLQRILQVYQFWTHRLYPKTPFKDTVERIEKLCHSKRMQVRLSVWHDEAKGLVNGKKLEETDGDDVIDLTDPNIEDADVSTKNDDSSSLRVPSLPPSSDAEDDDFDIDAVVREEEKRLAAFRAERSASPAPPAPKARYKNLPAEVADEMDVDEEALWNDLEAFDDIIPNPAPPTPKNRESNLLAEDEEMWDMVRELEREEHTASKQLPVSSVLITPSAESANTSLGTNDEDFDDIYA